ncbi:hypothetical protein [Wolbachia pipientis]|uniref:hypothetical protein n=1 Tax=Wolbachia pipientis TaxID=955 RepID=UPI0020306263|nr:hypothetical protein [Wolbachia pipientis]MCM1002145.1 hypothetical protein [Wolbachia pipientis]
MSEVKLNSKENSNDLVYQNQGSLVINYWQDRSDDKKILEGKAENTDEYDIKNKKLAQECAEFVLQDLNNHNSGDTHSQLEDDPYQTKDDNQQTFFFEESSLLIEQEVTLIENERKLISEFYKEMQDAKSKANTKSALEYIKSITDKYLERGIRINSYCDNDGEVIVNLIFKEIAGVLDNIVFINSRTVAPEMQPYDSSDDDEEDYYNLDIIREIAHGLLQKGGKVKESLFYHDRIRYSTTAFIDNNSYKQFDEYLIEQYKEMKKKLKDIAYECIVNKSEQTQDKLEVEIDNIYFYIRYPQTSIIEPVKIIANQEIIDRGLRVHILKIGKSTVKIDNRGEKRNYVDLTEGSDVVLTFYTSLGELEVRLYPHETDKNLIRVEVSDEDLLEDIESYNEEIGQNCLLGGLSVIEAINRGFFVRSSGLMRPEVISESKNKKVSWAEREELRRVSREEITR